MIILCIKTSDPVAELAIYNGKKKLSEVSWMADRKLSLSLNKKISEILNKSSILSNQLQGIIIFEGPGSFTGLRIGFSVANALAYSWKLPIVAAGGPNWVLSGANKLASREAGQPALPKYGKLPNTSKPKK